MVSSVFTWAERSSQRPGSSHKVAQLVTAKPMLLPPFAQWREHVYKSIMHRKPLLRLRHSAIPVRPDSPVHHSSDSVLKTNLIRLGWVVLKYDVIVANIFRHLLCALILEKRKTESVGGWNIVSSLRVRLGPRRETRSNSGALPALLDCS